MNPEDKLRSRIAELEADMRWMRGAMAGIAEDLESLKRALPPSKRGARVQSAIDSINQRTIAWLGKPE